VISKSSRNSGSKMKNLTVLAVLTVVLLISARALCQAAGANAEAEQVAIEKECNNATRMHLANPFCPKIAAFLKPANAGDSDAGRGALESPQTNAVPLAQAVIFKNLAAQAATFVQLESQRLDKEQGAPPSADGSTNLVSKPGAPQLLALAVQSGALTQTQNGNTTTVQGNVDQLVRFVGGSPGPLIYSNGGTPFLKNVTVSATLNLSSPSSTSVPLSTSATSGTVPATTASTPTTATKLSSLTARYQFENKYDPKDAKFQQAYAQQLTKLVNEASLAGAFTKYFTDISPPTCNNYSTTDTLADTIRKLDQCLNDTIAEAESQHNVQLSDLAKAAGNLTSAAETNAALYRQAIATAAGVPFTFEYVYNRPQSQPDTHDFRGILAWNAGAGILNVNFAASIYGSQRPANASYGLFRDAQGSFEFDRSFTNSTNSPSWSIAGYCQWQNSPSVIVLNSSSVPSGITLPPNAQSFIMGTKGWLGVVQGKITLKIGTAQFPIAAKWSNKTDLLDKHSFGGQFGLTYDLSQLKQLFGGASGQ